MLAVFDPPAAKEVGLALNRLAVRAESQTSPWRGDKVVFQSVRAALRKSKQDIVRSVEQGVEPELLAWIMVASAARSELQSGRHHIYRGALAPAGLEIKALFHHAMDFMVKRDFHSQADAEEHLDNLRKDIAEVG